MKKQTFKLKTGSSVLLDLIRGLSAQVVLIGHGIWFFEIFTFLHEPQFPWIQNIAVLIFFLLSGLLITYSTSRKLEADPTYSFGFYFIDRFSRIYTAFVPALVFVFLIDWISMSFEPFNYPYETAFGLISFIGNLFMLADFPIFELTIGRFYIAPFGSARPFWTLAIEWWIYMCFGYIILVILKKNKISIKHVLILAGLSIVPVYNLILGRGNGLTLYWIFGAGIYFLLKQNILQSISRKVKLFLVIILTLFAFIRTYLMMEAYDPIFAFFLALSLWLLVDLFQDYKFSENLTKAIRFNASYSYTLYLVHFSVLSFIKLNFFEQYNPYLLFLIGFIISNCISLIVGRYSELYLTSKAKIVLYRILENKHLTMRNKANLKTKESRE